MCLARKRGSRSFIERSRSTPTHTETRPQHALLTHFLEWKEGVMPAVAGGKQRLPAGPNLDATGRVRRDIWLGIQALGGPGLREICCHDVTISISDVKVNLDGS